MSSPTDLNISNLNEKRIKMGEFDYDGPQNETVGYRATEAKAKKCRPDFEGAIEMEKDKRVFMQNLYDSIKEMVLSDFSFDLNTNKLKDLMGSIHVKMLVSDQAVERIIREQESYRD